MSEFERQLLEKKERLITAVNNLTNEVALSNDLKALELSPRYKNMESKLLDKLVCLKVKNRRNIQWVCMVLWVFVN